MYKLLLLCLLLIPHTLYARSITEIRAAYLFKLASYTEFEAVKGSAINFCFLDDIDSGPGKLLSDKQSVLSQRLNYQIVTVSIDDFNNNYDSCQFLYIKKQQHLQAKEITEKSKQHVFFVGENKDFLLMGGTLALIPYRSKVQIHVGRSQIKNKSFKLSSQLLGIAHFYPN